MENRKRHGFTLAESVAAMTIVALLMAIILGFYVQAARLTGKTGLLADTQYRAAMAIRGLTEKLRGAMTRDTSSTSDRLIVIFPLTDGSGRNVIPLQQGPRYQYYLSNDTGSIGASGTSLWRARAASATSPWEPEEKLATDVSAVQFTYPDQFTVRMKVTVTVTRKGKSVSASNENEILLRNSLVQL